MLTFSMLKPLGGILKRLDSAALVDKLKDVDMGADGAAEKFGVVVAAAILPKIEDVADDVVRLAAAYKGVSFEDAQQLDPIATLKDLFKEPGLIDFFSSAARRAGLK